MKIPKLPRAVRIQNNRLLRKSRRKTSNVVKPNKSSEVLYRKSLLSLYSDLASDVEKFLFTSLRDLESEFVKDSYAITLEKVFENLRNGYSDIDRQAKIMASSFVDKGNNSNRTRFYKAMSNAIGVDVASVVQSENLGDVLTIANRENINLIKSIPEQYLSKVESIVFNNITQSSSAKSMIDSIVELNGISTKRAKLIARDQTSKLNSALTKARQENLGIVEYIWRTVGDGDRVRESHRRNDGKIFRWDTPPPETGHPGQDIQCRCIAQAIVKI